MGGVLAGFTFTATIFLIQYRGAVVYGDYFLGTTAILSLIFLYSTVSYTLAASDAAKGNIRSSKRFGKIAADLAGLGFAGIIFTLVGLVFAVSIVSGILSVIAAICLFVYVRLR